jgi:hypothetical protein
MRTNSRDMRVRAPLERDRMAIEQAELSEVLVNVSDVLDRLSDVLTNSKDVLINPRHVLINLSDVLINLRDVLINLRDVLIKLKMSESNPSDVDVHGSDVRNSRRDEDLSPSVVILFPDVVPMVPRMGGHPLSSEPHYVEQHGPEVGRTENVPSTYFHRRSFSREKAMFFWTRARSPSGSAPPASNRWPAASASRWWSVQ